MIVHGLAGQIRSVEESETFDLAGQNATTISSTIVSAFTKPFVRSDLSCMVRITLVIGAGKQARQKYDDNALKVITQALQQCNYIEDRAASSIPECAGSYKSQHDTAKNLKTIVIFPKMILQNDTNNNSTSLSNNNSNIPSLIPIDSPKYKIAVSSMSTFTSMLKSKCPSWIQKKGCLQCLEEIKDMISNLDQKLITGKGLNESEQAFYDIVISIESKEKLVRDEMQKHLESNTITLYEKQLLLDQNLEKIKELKRENKSYEKAQQRKELIEQITPLSQPVPLRYDPDIRKLHKELVPLVKFYDQNKGKLLSIGDANKITRKEEIEQEIVRLEEDSRGWFEDDNEYKRKVQVTRDILKAAIKPASTKKQSSSATVSSVSYAAAANANGKSNGTVGGTKWVVPSEMGSTKSARKFSSSSKGQKKGNGLFSAMMIDDSDDDDDDDDVGTQPTTIPSKQQPKPKQTEVSRDGFTEVQATKSKANGQQSTSPPTKTSTGKGSVFTKSKNYDSDDESEKENESIHDNNDENVIDDDTKEQTDAGTKSKKKNKKNKKKGNIVLHVQDTSRESEDALNEAYQKTKQRELTILEEKKKQRENEHLIVSIVRVLGTLALEVSMAIINKIISAVFGNKKPNNNNVSKNRKRK